jgi:prohibitin 2
METKWIVSGVVGLVLVVLTFVFFPLTSVPPAHVGIVTVLGKVEAKPLQSGLSVVHPLAQVIDVNIQQQAMAVKGEVGTKDLQSVDAAVTVNYHPVPDTMPKLYTEVGMAYPARIVEPAVLDRLKTVTSKFNAEELITKREEVRRQARAAIAEAVRERSGGMLVVDDVAINNMGFAKSFTQAVELKQVAEQHALRAERDLTRIKIEAQQKIEVAKAEAESLRVQKEQITPAMLQLRTIEMQTEAVKKWDGKMPYFNGGGAIPFINVGKQP